MTDIVHDPVEAHIAQKVFLRDGNKLLILKLIDEYGGYWDFPGGRVNTNIRDDQSHNKLIGELHREVREEIGEGVKYTKDPRPVETAFMVPPHKPHRNIFMVFYEAQYNGGDVVLCDEHQEYKWVDVMSYDPKAEDDYWTPSYWEVVERYMKRERGK